MSFDILNRWTRAVIFHSETAIDLGAAVKEAVVSRADLSSANLHGANLRYANLHGAYLDGADLGYAYLNGANLNSAGLRYANLHGAYLSGADLSYANLHGADLNGANLHGAGLRYANLHGADLGYAYLNGANLNSADLHGANLSYADLRYANLHGANLHSANLHGADLGYADLHGANLHGANLHSAVGIEANRTTPLLILKDQPGKIRAYKLADSDGGSPTAPSSGYDRLIYSVGTLHEALDANRDSTVHCGAGLNLATLDWCMREWKVGMRIMIAEFEAGDIAAIPTATDGKFRVFRCKIVGEKDLAEIGLVRTTAKESAKS